MVVSPWSSFEPGHVGFCEARLDGWIVEPANAWSSLAYIAAGAYLAGRARRRNDAPLLLVGTTAILVGFGSFTFHATATFFGEFADETSMFLIGALMGALALRRVLGWGLGRSAASFALMAGTATVTLACAHGSGLVVFAVQVAMAVSLELFLWRESRGESDYRYLKITLALFAAAYALWWMDFGKVLCDPRNHTFGAHAAWHTLTALALVSYQRFQEQFTSASLPALAPPEIPLPSPVPLPTPPPAEPVSVPRVVESLRAIRARAVTVPDSSPLRS